LIYLQNDLLAGISPNGIKVIRWNTFSGAFRINSRSDAGCSAHTLNRKIFGDYLNQIWI